MMHEEPLIFNQLVNEYKASGRAVPWKTPFDDFLKDIVNYRAYLRYSLTVGSPLDFIRLTGF